MSTNGNQIIVSFFDIFEDHSYISDTSSIAITSDEIGSTLPCNSTCSTWPLFSFGTSDVLKIKFYFQRFILENQYIDIGDGIVRGRATRLARFSNTDSPNNVSSVSNAAWLTIASPCGNRIFSLTMVIAAEDKSCECH